MPLFPHILFDPAETALSVAARLAAIHTKGRLRPFLTDLGIKSEDFAGGDRAAIAALCHHAALPTDAVTLNTPISLANGFYRLRTAVISSEFLCNPVTFFCPACLLTDDASSDYPAQVRLGRFEWPLRVVRTCPVHGQSLLERRPDKESGPLHEMAVRVPERGAELEAMALAATRRPPSPLQIHAVSRLAGGCGPEWLDAQSLEQALRATEQLGVLIEFGPARGLKSLTTDEWDQAGRTGFTFTSRGEQGIREALHLLQNSLLQQGRRPLRRNVFGRLYEWVDDNERAIDPGDIKRIVREHIFGTVALAAGETVLGESLPKRRLHSVASLAKETGLHPLTLTNVLLAKGLVPLKDPSRPFDAAAGRSVAAAMSRLVHVISLPGALGCSRPQANALIDERILSQIATGEAGTPGRTQKAVDQREIDAFRSALSARAKLVEVLPLGYVPIAKAAEKVKVPSVDIVHLILGGFLEEIIALRGLNGYAAIHVQPSELAHVIGKVLTGIAPSQAAAKIGFPTETVWALIDENGETPAKLPSVTIQPLIGHHVIRRVELDDFTRFRAQFVKSSDIANYLEVPRALVERDLRRYRVPSTYSAAQIGVALYRVQDLPAKLREMRETKVA